MVEEVSTDALEKALNSERNIELIDIRTTSEFMDCRISSAENIPMSELSSNINKRDWGDEIYFICRHGRSSKMAVRLLNAFEGVDDDAYIASVEGGYLDWDGELSGGQEPKKAVA